MLVTGLCTNIFSIHIGSTIIISIDSSRRVVGRYGQHIAGFAHIRHHTNGELAIQVLVLDYLDLRDACAVRRSINKPSIAGREGHAPKSSKQEYIRKLSMCVRYST